MRKYQNVLIEKLKPYEKNARTHSEEQIEKIAKSIEEFGFLNPVLIDAGFGIIAGHGRVLAAQKIGMKEVPCLFIEDLSETQKRAYIIADNKLALDAGWDFDVLKIELEALKDLNFDIELTGFSDFNFNLDSGEKEEITDDDFEEELPEEPKSKLGVIYGLGRHRLMCGDSANPEDAHKLMNGETADLLVTDPPYNVNYEGETKKRMKIQNDNMNSKEFILFLTDAFKNIDGYLKNGGSFYVWFASKETLAVYKACENVSWEIRQQLIWNKNRMCFGRQDYQWKHEPCIYGWKSGDSHYFIDDRTQTTVLEFDKQFVNAEHPTMKPVPLIAKLVENSSKRDEIVIDLFGGSGTALIACEQLNRGCRMMELDPRYCDVIIKRWENLTGEKAVKIN
ncbi:MAG: site-specific DNA-methyltransferase [Oscillospiraceae bacterium]|jgi:site-specific DNA-methyltransferase (adenine-specific)|nr:site-specific DNA-methyltransferase [Oscillospiraceae bacterium]